MGCDNERLGKPSIGSEPDSFGVEVLVEGVGAAHAVAAERHHRSNRLQVLTRTVPVRSFIVVGSGSVVAA